MAQQKDQSGTLGIDGSGLHGIDGSGLHGIDGSGLHGIDGSGLHGIDGSGLHGIDGSGLHGIDGSGLHGIDGSGLHGIDGSGLHGIDGSGILLRSLAMGPVESIEVAGGSASLTVVGQAYTATSALVATVAIGDYVIAASDLSGELTLFWQLSEQYVPGSSSIRLRGSVTGTRTEVGELSINGATLNYTAHLSVDPDYAPQVGDLLEVVAIQPVPGQVLVLGGAEGNSGGRARR